MIDPASSRPLYRQLADAIRSKIRSGEYQTGTEIPSERELIEEYGASRTTIRLALGVLRNEGLIAGGQGRRPIVRAKPPMRHVITHADSRVRRQENAAQGKGDTFRADLADAGRDGHFVISVATELPDEAMATRLEVSADTPVLVRRRTRFVDNEPSQTEDSYHPAAMVADTPIAVPEDFAAGTLQVLEEIGHGPVRSTHEILCRAATPDESHRLGLVEGEWVMERTQLVYDAENRPVEVVTAVYPTSRGHVLIAEVSEA
ncbi:GntR family transcriptional regulator [Pseudofrankia sp. DC12]|uniref:GntR family transcriptional regulator n=1 Tax=Pseudofrankia sp. DC12 TaxID=683315 RepID=UPI000ACE3F03|nr:GntR family transcriptional regulator [Pseudofrankia sp. DC12]